MKNAKKLLSGALAAIMVSTSLTSFVYAETLTKMSADAIKKAYTLKATTDKSDIFTVDDKKFILLDSMEDGSYFIMAYDGYGSAQYDSGSKQKYDISSDTNIGKYVSNTAKAMLPTGIQSHLVTTTWETEPGTKYGNAQTQYSFEDEISLISATEFTKYVDKIGIMDIVRDDGVIATWASRTADVTWDASDHKCLICFTTTKDTDSNVIPTLGRWALNGTFTVRPVMYINNDFFKDVKIDVYTIGDNVKSLIKSKYLMSDLSSADYTQDELNTLFDVVPVVKPVINTVSISGGNIPNKDELSSSVTYDENTLSVNYQWQFSVNDKDYSDISGANAEKFALTNAQGSKYVRLAVTPVGDKGVLGDTVYSNAILVEPAMVKQTAASVAALGLKMVTDGKDIFTVDNQKFILLEAKDNGEYFVMGYDSYGTSNFDPNSTQKYDITDENNIGYYVTNTLWNRETSTETELAIPQKVKAHAVTKTWRTEPGTKYGNAASEYEFEAPISLISATEFAKYNDIIGISDLGTAWTTRTADVTWDAADHKCVICFALNSNTQVWSTGRWAITGSFHIRPVMYLDSDFFKDAKVDVYTLGDTVKEVMIAKNTEAELAQADYTAEELDFLYGRETIVKPVISSVTISGENYSGQVLSSEVVYDENTASVNYQWEVSSDDKTYSAIGAATSDKFTVTNAQGGKYVRLAVTPVNDKGSTGDTVYSNSIYVEEALTKKKADEITALGLKEYTEAADIFVIDDKKFIMLDTNDKDEFFVMAYDAYGKSKFDADKTSKYDMNDENNIGYFVINTIWADLGDKVLPKTVKNHVVTKTWRTEPGNNASNCKNTEYSFSAPITLISATEFIEHKDIIGVRDIETAWTTRTADSTWEGADHTCCIGLGKNTSTNLWSAIRWSLDGSYETRPVMYLDKDFFLDAKIPADQLGANVIDKMKKVYTVAELKTVYSKQDLNTYFGLSDFAIASASITASTTDSKTVTATVTSSSAEETDALFIVAVYDATGEVLKGIATDSVTTSANAPVDKTLTVNVADSSDSDIVKVMLWDSWKNIVPLCNDKIAE